MYGVPLYLMSQSAGLTLISQVNWIAQANVDCIGIIIIIIIINNNGLIAFPHCGYSMLQKVTCIYYDNIKLLQYYSILQTYTLQEIMANDKNDTKQWIHYVTI